CLRLRLSTVLGSGGHRGGRRLRATRPDQDATVFIHRQLFRIDQVFFERFQQVVIELQAQFEDPIGKTVLPLQERQGLGQDGIVVHYRPSTCASTASVWGSQKVISMAWYISMAVMSAVWARSR